MMALSFDQLIEKTRASLQRKTDGSQLIFEHTNPLMRDALIRAVLDALEMDVDDKGMVFTRYTITPSYDQQNFRSGRGPRRRR